MIRIIDTRALVKTQEEMNVQLKLKTISGDTPVYLTPGSSGFDIASNETVTIKKGKVQLVHTGLFLEIPDGFEIQIRSRSGLSLKDRVFVLNSPGTVDCDYRGEIGVILMNLGDKDFIINKGDRIAQCVLTKVYKAVFEITDTLSETERGTEGFGSTGEK